MNKKILLSILSIGLLVSCNESGGGKHHPDPTLSYIELSGDYQTTFTVGDEFNYDGLIVTAFYSDDNSEVVEPTNVSTPNMNVTGNQNVEVTYLTVSETYSIMINPLPDIFPLEQIRSFLLERGADLTNFVWDYSVTSISSYSVVDEELPYFIVSADDSDSSKTSNLLSALNGSGWTSDYGMLLDPSGEVDVKVYNANSLINIEFYAHNDVVEVPPEVDPDANTTDEFVLYQLIGNENNLASNTVSPFTHKDHGDFTFSFAANGGNSPISSNKGGSSPYKCVALYKKNTMTVSTASSKYLLKKIELSTPYTNYNGEMTADIGTVNQTSTMLTWEGSTSSMTFTTVGNQYRFDNVKIYYYKPAPTPVPEGLKTIAEIKEIAEDLVFTGSDGYLVNRDFEVKVNLKAIDAIDSTSTSGGLPANARAKMLCVDDTGYILCSSGTSSSNPIDLYQRVKKYIKDGTTTYYVTGHLAKLNGVLEINVETYKYDPDLEFEYDLNDYLNSEVIDSDSFMNHAKEMVSNPNGYGAGDIVRLNGLTYFNKYNSKGSYYFLDQESNLVPIYSLEDKDRPSLQLGKVYDIIGLESLYKGRPSLRILEVKANSTVEPASFDFREATEVSDIKHFYSVNENNASYKEEFFSSVTTIYKMDVYVSSYAADKYTFNTSYYKSGNVYTTGNSQTDAAHRWSLGVFNEDLDYKQTFLDFELGNASTPEECEELKLTLYFTLGFLDTVDGKAMWRANVFEDLVFSLDYYESESKTIRCNYLDASFTHDSEKQIFESGDIKVTNSSTTLSDYAYDPSYLKIVDGTALKINFTSDIIAFKIEHATYSYIAGLGDLDVKAYHQFKSYTLVLLKTPTNEVVISDFAVGGNHNNSYLRVDSITVNYK